MTNLKPQPTIDLVVVTFQNPPSEIAHLVETFLAAAKNLGVRGTVQLVSNDGDSPLAGWSNVRTHVGHGNVGFARGVALGLRSSHAAFCVLANPDCHPSEEAIEAILKRLVPGCGILVPRLIDTEGAFAFEAYENWTFTPGRKWSHWRCRRAMADLPEGPLPKFAKAPGTFLGMETALARRLGSPFDDNFFLYAEDRDLSDRARVMGVEITYLPHVEITHEGGVSAKSAGPLVTEAKADGYVRIARRRYGHIGTAIAIGDLAILKFAKRQSAANLKLGPLVRRWAARAEPPRLELGDSRGSSESAPLRALVLWADNSAANLGVRVLAQGNAQTLEKAVSPQEAHVDCQDFGPGDSEASFGTRAIVRDLISRRGPIKTKLASYDVILDSGAGDSFTDIYGMKRLSFMAYTQWRARRLGIPVVLGPQTIGPFTSRWGRALAKPIVRNAILIATRDESSAAYCKSTFGREVDILTTDLVFGLSTTPRRQKRDVVLNVSGLLWFGDAHVNHEVYRRETIHLIHELVNQGRDVSLLAHVVHSRNGFDDVDAIRDLRSRLPSSMDLEVVVPETLDEARRLLRSATIVVGARMHACLNALSQGVPAIAWAYSRKFEPLMASINWPHVIDLRSASSPGDDTVNLINSQLADLTSLAESVPDIANPILGSYTAILASRLREAGVILEVQG
ncbi:polysaccharide pyruvyl transferase family protein [Aeromicrobium fastidiosum]|uniref:Polysaccharide pyruvyl transferase domain-containing protein n=1 Tax=Aeromicrobium fastidiosum TaxID=52699 RepID=A0A641AR95_9ACTN|nr:polysaccharide pyruvyl transferase family protein [Aeromicrobium fastidiosum]KAA1380475.1 hypothetical protein ESP62_004665 [Aeromicrobium fastidiosum]MBP2390059.1 polysaccharide pyruvyl transferase WcaK-like protein/GT2 family glycosyltransferase [Aeromicrobium fastidiosum]